MGEIRKTLAIIKNRWPEVTLVLGLYAIGLIAINSVKAEEASLTASGLLLLIFSLAVMTAAVILKYGFLRTAHLEGQRQQLTSVLFRVGKQFFWRMAGYGILILGACLLLLLPLLIMVNGFAFSDVKIFEMPPWVMSLCFIAATIVLLKPLLFIPALIMGLDCGVFDSINLLKEFSFLRAKPVLVLFLLQIMFSLMGFFLGSSSDNVSMLYWIYAISLSIVKIFLELMIVITAIRFVVSLNLLYDENGGTAAAEDFIEE